MLFHSVFHLRPGSLSRCLRRAAVPLLMTAACCGCQRAASDAQPATGQVYAMDTYMELTAYGETASAAVEETSRMIYQLDALLDRTAAGSITYAINHAGGTPVPIDRTVHDLLAAAIEYGQFTQGRFDISIAPIADLWGFTQDAFHVPSDAEIEAVMPLVGLEHLHLSEDQVVLDAGSEIDFGGIAKGLAAEQAYAIFLDSGVEHALANLGGDLLVLGEKPGGEPWRVGIQSPFAADVPGQYAGILTLSDAYVLTSGSYERYFEENGTIYHHIIDPLTGSPSSSGLASVTVVSDLQPGAGTLCDALSTALFTLSPEDAISFWQAHASLFQMILISDAGELWITDGLWDSFQPPESEDFTVHLIH